MYLQLLYTAVLGCMVTLVVQTCVSECLAPSPHEVPHWVLRNRDASTKYRAIEVECPPPPTLHPWHIIPFTRRPSWIRNLNNIMCFAITSLVYYFRWCILNLVTFMEQNNLHLLVQPTRSIWFVIGLFVLGDSCLRWCVIGSEWALTLQ